MAELPTLPSQDANTTLQSLEGLSFSDSDPYANPWSSQNGSSNAHTIAPPKDDTAESKDSLAPETSSASRSPSPRNAKVTEEETWDEKQALRDGQDTDIGDFEENTKDKSANVEESKEEISSIIGQFENDKVPDIKSPVREHPVFQYPPRSSSLDHVVESPKVESPSIMSPTSTNNESIKSPSTYAPSISSQHQPPEPDPEPDAPFDFHRFLEQLRHRQADPVAKFLRSFLQEFGKKQWRVDEQRKIISDFLTFITNRMAQCEVWRNVSDAEFDNAKEGMEKLVMNRLYTQTFSPEIPAGETSPLKGRRRGTNIPLGTGRRGLHQEDVERDDVLAQKMRIYGWIREQHLDIKPFTDKGRRFLQLAQQELVKIKSYRAPRDKIICLLNCCKVIFGYLRNAESESSADDFLPLLIYTVLKAKPDHLVSNAQYITRFRNQDKLNGEAGYYMSSLLGAIQFIENLDRTNLTISDTEFDKNVEAAVSEITAHNERDEQRNASSSRNAATPNITIDDTTTSTEGTPRNSSATQRTNDTSTSPDERAPVANLLRTIQKPLSSIGRIFSDESAPTINSNAGRPPLTPQPSTRPSRPSTDATPPRPQSYEAPPGPPPGIQRQRSRLGPGLQDEDAAALQASAESAEARRIMVAEHRTVVETLAGMFPDLDKDIIGDVVRMKGGQIGQAVDACLALSR